MFALLSLHWWKMYHQLCLILSVKSQSNFIKSPPIVSPVTGQIVTFTLVPELTGKMDELVLLFVILNCMISKSLPLALNNYHLYPIHQLLHLLLAHFQNLHPIHLIRIHCYDNRIKYWQGLVLEYKSIINIGVK